MILSDAAKRADTALSWVRSLPTVVLLSAALAGAVWWGLREHARAGRAEDTHAAEVEAEQVRDAKVAVAQETERAGLERQLAAAIERESKATGKASDLQAEVKRLLAAAPGGGHVTDVTVGDTGWSPTGVLPAGGATEAGGGPGASSPPATPPARTCLFHEGDEGRIHTDQVRARYAHGTVGVVGTADAFGRAPGGDARHLFGGPLTLDVAVEGAPPEIPTNRWTALATGGTGGWGGEAVVSHRFDWGRFHPEVSAKGEVWGSGVRAGVGVGGSF